jgi:hypothetical protein
VIVSEKGRLGFLGEPGQIAQMKKQKITQDKVLISVIPF